MSEGELQEAKTIVEKKLEAVKDIRRRNTVFDRELRRINVKAAGVV